MSAPWIKGYKPSSPSEANSPNRPSQQTYREPGHMAKAVKERWKDAPEAYPYGRNKDGGQ